MSGATFFLSSSSSTRLISFPNLFSSHLLSQLLTSSSYLFCLLSSSLPLLFPSSSFSLLLLPPSPTTSLAGGLSPGLRVSVRSPGIEARGPPLSYPFPIQPLPALKRGTLRGTPHPTWPINGPIPWLQPWASRDRGQCTALETQPQRFSPEILQSCAAHFFSCLPLPGQVPLPATPTSPCVRTSHLCLYTMSSNSHPPPALLWSLSSSASEPLAPRVWKETQTRRPRQADPGGLGRPGPLTPARRLLSVHTGPRNHLTW